MKNFFKIFLVDNFDSFTFNLVDYFRQLGCDVDVYRNTVAVSKIQELKPDLIVFSPGPSVPQNAGNMMKIIHKYHRKYPMFGVCLGHEAFIEYFGGSLKFVKPVHGRSSKIRHDNRSIFQGLEQDFLAGRYHSLCADKVPDCFEVSAEAEGLVMAMRHKELAIESVQFHPESVLTMKGGNGFKIIKNVVQKNLGVNEIEKFLLNSIDGQISLDKQVEFLEKYQPDKITAEQLMIFVNFMMGKVTKSLNMPEAIDVCGTGGSGLNRINTSTISAFILASLGVGIAKHGNKAASGRFGSFDLLEALGVNIERENLEQVYSEEKLAFIYARKFHPMMKYFAEARAKIGKPTVFNLLGPLLNPANPKKQIIGTAFKNQLRLIAETCKLLDKERVMVVGGCHGLDEVSLSGPTEVVELKDGKIFEYQVKPEDFGIKPCNFEDINIDVSSKDKEFNIKIALDILNRQCKTRHADLLYINSALTLKLAGVTDDLKEAYKMAKSVMGINKLESYKGNILREIAASKLLRKSDKDFYAAIRKPGLSVIAEIKKSSPSEGQVFAGDFDVEMIAKLYEEGGASAISVLTDEKYFEGNFEYLRKVAAVTKLPLLCKDFIISDYQIKKAREYGADAILLIAALLSIEDLKRFLALIKDLDMEALVEVHNEKELEKILQTEAKIIAINNRDLRNFSVDLETTKRLVKLIPKDKLVVSESGFAGWEDLKKLDARVNAILVGTAIMRSQNIKEKLNEFTKAISSK